MQNTPNDEINYILAPFVNAKFIENNLVFCFGSVCSVINHEYVDVQNSILNATIHLLKPIQLSALKKILISEYQIPEILSNKTIEFLVGNNYVIPHAQLPDKTHRYSRNWNYYLMHGANPDDVQNNLKKSHVCFVGCGGIGSLMSTALSASGVENITLVDDDRIEESNLTRQIMFTENDIGKNKTDTLKNVILSRNSKTNVSILNQKIYSENDLKILPHCDLLILSGDEPSYISEMISNHCHKTATPYMIVGYVTDYPHWSINNPSENSLDQSLKIDAPHEYVNHLNKINSRSSVPSIAHVNLISVGLALNDALMFLGKFNKPHALNEKVSLALDELRFIRSTQATNAEKYA